MSEEVVLINPPAEASKERQYARTKEPRLGLAYLAAYLEEQNVQPKIIDAKFEGLGFREVLDKVKMQNPTLIGITAVSPEIIDAARIATELKRELPQTPVVIGGAHASALPIKTLEDFSCFDFLIYGEGEVTLYELISALEGGKGLDGIEGLVFRKGEEIRCNKARPFYKNIDELPFPAWHLLSKVAEQYPILASRGCPYRCIFCNRTLGSKLRARSAQKIVEEVEAIHTNYNARRLSFHDETFGLSRRRAHELLDMLIERGLPDKVSWDITTRVDVVDYELLRKLKRAGCFLIGYGIESGNQEILNFSQKGITLEQSERAVALAKAAGLKTASFFILGHLNETKKTIDDTLNFAVKLNTTTVSFAIMVPYPGTEIAQMVERGEGNYKLLSQNWADYGIQVGSALELKNISRGELERSQLKGYLKFYLHNFSLSKLWELFKLIGFRGMVGYLTSVPLKWFRFWKKKG